MRFAICPGIASVLQFSEVAGAAAPASVPKHTSSYSRSSCTRSVFLHVPCWQPVSRIQRIRDAGAMQLDAPDVRSFDALLGGEVGEEEEQCTSRRAATPTASLLMPCTVASAPSHRAPDSISPSFGRNGLRRIVPSLTL